MFPYCAPPKAGLFCAMLVATLNKPKELLLLTYVGHLKLAELVRQRDNLQTLLNELSAGFRVIADFTNLDAMDADCFTEIGKIMEIFDEKCVGLIARVIPDASKDMGMTILANFHYKQPPQMLICKTFAEAATALSL